MLYIDMHIDVVGNCYFEEHGHQTLRNVHISRKNVKYFLSTLFHAEAGVESEGYKPFVIFSPLPLSKILFNCSFVFQCLTVAPDLIFFPFLSFCPQRQSFSV